MGEFGKAGSHIFLSAGEASGDLHGSRLALAIRSVAPQTRISGLGGTHMKAAGVSMVVDNRDISVVGAFEVLNHARDIYRSWRAIKSHLKTDPPDLVVLIDFPDFNLLLGRFVKRAGGRLFYYISPQIWAWREGRVRSLRRMVDCMAVILPFEKDFYRSRGMDVHYVGHPLVDILSSAPDKAQSDSLYRADLPGPLIGLLPGSRRSEIRFLFDLLMESAKLILTSFPKARFLIPVAPSLDPDEISARAAGWGLPARIVPNDTYGAIRACDLILTASGTVTLEAAMLGTPMIITNRVSGLSAQIGKRLIHVQYIGLPNLIAGREIAPEFVQYEARADLLAQKAVSLLESPGQLEAQKFAWKCMREQLGKPGVSERVADLVLKTARGVRCGS